jgi:hypothetical protein
VVDAVEAKNGLAFGVPQECNSPAIVHSWSGFGASNRPCK